MKVSLNLSYVKNHFSLKGCMRLFGWYEVNAVTGFSLSFSWTRTLTSTSSMSNDSDTGGNTLLVCPVGPGAGLAVPPHVLPPLEAAGAQDLQVGAVTTAVVGQADQNMLEYYLLY